MKVIPGYFNELLRVTIKRIGMKDLHVRGSKPGTLEAEEVTRLQRSILFSRSTVHHKIFTYSAVII
jgi:hypothetical protein